MFVNMDVLNGRQGSTTSSGPYALPSDYVPQPHVTVATTTTYSRRISNVPPTLYAKVDHSRGGSGRESVGGASVTSSKKYHLPQDNVGSLDAAKEAHS